ncbi:MAG: LysR family transcriptional regulator, partial [Bdellovibrionales bacterium]|nr:LysR family transcriptional regulator [Bdellovibrionales bacterium]
VKVRQVEDILNSQLLIRTSQGVRLSEQGHRVQSFVNEIIRLANELRLTLHEEPHELQGVIRLGLYESVAKYYWPRFFRIFRDAYPGIKIQITTGRSRNLIQKLKEKHVDLAITIEPMHDYQLSHQELFHDSFSVYGEYNYLKENFQISEASTKCEITPEQMSALTIISFNDALAHNGKPLQSELARLGMPLENVNEVESFEVAVEFCLQGLGIAVLPNRVVRAHSRSEHLIPVTLPGIVSSDFSEHKICASTTRGEESQPLITTLLKEIINNPMNQAHVGS